MKSLEFAHQHVDKLEEARRILGVAELGLSVLDHLVPCEDWLLVPAQHGLHLDHTMSHLTKFMIISSPRPE